jgi:hypothetical protein
MASRFDNPFAPAEAKTPKVAIHNDGKKIRLLAIATKKNLN